MNLLKSVLFCLMMDVGRFTYSYYDPCESTKYQSDISIPSDLNSRSKRAATSDKNKLWENGIIPFEISNRFHGKEKLIIHKAIDHWQRKTCLLFVSRTTETEYVIFSKKHSCGCCSFVGRMGSSRPQAINLSNECINFGTILHELGHLIGFWHEHTRPDRDNYLDVFRQNIQSGKLQNFEKKTKKEINSLGVQYDYGSLMHYGKTTYAKRFFTLLPKNDRSIAIGQRKHLSKLDAKQANLLYSCPTCQITFTKPHGVIEYKLKANFTGFKACNIRIIAPDGHQIFILFEYLNFQLACPRSFLRTNDGGRKDDIYCRDRLPPHMFLTKTNHFSLNFVNENKFLNEGIKPIGLVAKYKVLCGGYIERNSGFIQSPNYPSPYNANQVCEWTIKVNEGNRIVFRFDLLKVERTPQCTNDYVQIFDVTSDASLGQFCRSREAKNVKTAGNEAKVRFHSNGAITKPGFSLFFKSVTIGCSAINGGCAHICIDAMTSHRCECYAGYVLHENKRDCLPNCNETFNVVYGQTGAFTLPQVYQHPIFCYWNLIGIPSYNIIIVLTNLKFTKKNNVEVEVYDMEEESQTNNLNIKDHHKLKITSNRATIKFLGKQKRASKHHSIKFYLEKDICSLNNGNCHQICNSSHIGHYCSCKFGYVLNKDGKACSPGSCHTSLKSTRGWITSPNYPKFYESGNICSWKIESIPGHKIIFSLEKELTRQLTNILHCPFVLSNKRWNVTACGNVSEVRSRNNVVKLNFLQGDSNALLKFKISYFSVCGGFLEASRKYRKIHSHLSYNGHTNYPVNHHCSWRITTVRKNQKVLLRFNHFNLENEPCRFDYVILYDGSTANHSVIAKLCGSKLKDSLYISSGNEVLIVFKTDASVSRAGFELEYKRTSMKSFVEYQQRSEYKNNNYGRRRDFFLFDKDIRAN